VGRAFGSSLLALALVALAPAPVLMQQPPASPTAGRLTIVLGDLHMGIGRDASVRMFRCPGWMTSALIPT